MVARSTGSMAERLCGTPGTGPGRGAPFSMTNPEAINQRLCLQPLAKGQRPLTQALTSKNFVKWADAFGKSKQTHLRTPCGFDLADDAYISDLAQAVTGRLGGKVGIAPRMNCCRVAESRTKLQAGNPHRVPVFVYSPTVPGRSPGTVP